MKTLVTGSDGRIGLLLMSEIKGAIGIPGPDPEIDPKLFEGVERVFHCSANANPEADYAEHCKSLALTARVLEVCHLAGVRDVYLCDTTWNGEITDERPQSHRTVAYGNSKHAGAVMGRAYPHGGVHSIRIGFYPAEPFNPNWADWLKAEYWTSYDVLRAFGLEASEKIRRLSANREG